MIRSDTANAHSCSRCSQFYLPDEYQEKPPEPENDKVFIETTPTIEVFVASFGGWNSQDKFTKAAAKLHATLRDGGRSVSDGAYYTAGYDSPFRLTNRHNEVRGSRQRCVSA